MAEFKCSTVCARARLLCCEAFNEGNLSLKYVVDTLKQSIEMSRLCMCGGCLAACTEDAVKRFYTFDILNRDARNIDSKVLSEYWITADLLKTVQDYLRKLISDPKGPAESDSADETTSRPAVASDRVPDSTQSILGTFADEIVPK